MQKMNVGRAVLIGFFKMVSFVIYVVVRFVLRYRYHVIKRNIENSFPNNTPKENSALIAAYYRHLGDLVVEPLLFSVASSRTRKELAVYTNKELPEELYRENRHAIILASHIGNWEFLINLPQEIAFKVYTAYTAISNVQLDNLVLKMRSMLGVTVILKRNFYRKALSVLRGGGDPAMVVVIADQRPAPGSAKYNIDFLGQSTSVQVGAERLALSSNAAVVYLQCTKVAQFHYHYTFQLLAESPAQCAPLEITGKYYQMMERDIRSQPGNWLWSHDRWKQLQ